MRPASRIGSGVPVGLRAGLVALMVIGAARAEGPDAPRDPPAPAAGDVLRAGRELFERVWLPNDPRSHGGDGLGPVFNAQSCVACHGQGGTGGAGPAERNIEIVTAAGVPSYQFAYAFGMDFGAGRFVYQISAGNPAAAPRRRPADARALAAIHPGFRGSDGVVLHRFGTDPDYHAWREAVPGPHGTVAVRTSQRNPTTLFGVGAIDAIPDPVLEAAARRGAASIQGRVSRLKDGRVGRFGWKAQAATLAEFVLSAAATEIGLEVPGHPQAADPRRPGIGAAGLDMDRDECEALVAFVRSLPAPISREAADAQEAARIAAGAATFRSIGCVGCHLPKLGPVTGLYSDLLLHDMGPALGDTDSYTAFAAPPAGAEVPADRDAARPRRGGAPATAREWRTPPLWGLRDSAPYLHDGRAATLEEAITLHGGQGAAAARRFAQLSDRRQRQLESFLLSLAAPPRPRGRPDPAEAP